MGELPFYHNRYFVIDSDTLTSVSSQLFGYVITDQRNIQSTVSLQPEGLSGDGAYVYIHRKENTISIYQDYLGSFGLYLFQEKDYFALSNSFILLVDHLKTKHSLSLNTDYANYFLTAQLCSVAYSETLVNEIRVLDRSAYVTIDIEKKSLDISFIDYSENTIPLNSPEGLQILDRWYQKWTSVIKALSDQECYPSVDLSGGFDSRLVFSLFLGSKINLDNICINSKNDTLYTHSEDFQIASAIGEHYHFTLNNKSSKTKSFPLSLRQSLDNSFYPLLGFHRQLLYKPNYTEYIRYNFHGGGGECIRDYWNRTPQSYIRSNVLRCFPFSPIYSDVLENSVRRIISTSISEIEQKFRRLGRETNSSNILHHLYRETRCRNHFGKSLLDNYYSGLICFRPLLDPELHKLSLDDKQCSDKNLLVAVIFNRYEPDLLKFPFEGNRSIDPKTLLYAQQINAQNPYIPEQSTSQKEYSPFCAPRPPFDTLLDHEKPASEENIKEAIKKAFYSQKIRSAFCSIYGKSTYRAIAADMETRAYHPMQYAITAIAISKLLLDTTVGKTTSASSPSDFVLNNLGVIKQKKYPISRRIYSLKCSIIPRFNKRSKLRSFLYLFIKKYKT